MNDFSTKEPSGTVWSTPPSAMNGAVNATPDALAGKSPISNQSGTADTIHHATAGPDGVLRLNCPKCHHPLNLGREHLGIEGHCVECREPLVAIEIPGSGVVLQNPNQRAAAPVIRETAPDALPESPFNHDPVAHPLTGPAATNPRPGFAQPVPVTAKPAPESNLPPNPGPPDLATAAMAGFTGSSSRARQNAASAPTAPQIDSFPGAEAMPPNAQPLGEPQAPFSPFSQQENAPVEHHSHPLSEAPVADSAGDALGNSEPESKPPRNALARGFASLLKKSSSDPKETAPRIEEPGVEAEKPPSNPQPVPSQLPWETGSNSAETGQADTPPQSPAPDPATPKESESYAKTEQWSVKPSEVKPDEKRTEKDKAPNKFLVPGSAIAEAGKRRRLVTGPRRGFLRFLGKMVIFLLLVTGIAGAGYFFTPEETIAQWKGKLIEFLKPGVVLREYLPFEVPLLERLAEEESAKNDSAPSGQFTPPSGPPPFPSAKIIEGPNPQAAVPVINGHGKSKEIEGFGPGLETISQVTLENFYRSESIEERARFLVAPESSLPEMWAFYQRFEKLPTLKSIAYRGPVRDSASGRWFSVFDVRENENEEVHRWTVMFTRAGHSKIDWKLYQQLKDDTLDRFLTDPAAPPKAFRLLVRRGVDTPPESNPWRSPAVELLLQLPLGSGPPQRIFLRQTDFQRLGFDTALAGGQSGIARLELAWTDSETEPARRIPTVRSVAGWGAW